MFPFHSNMATILFLAVFFPLAYTFDTYILAVQWPVSYCNVAQSSRPCKTPLPSDFTVHGLWPSNNNGSPVQPCTHVSMPPKKTVSGWPFASMLQSYWPNLNGDDYTFWDHEWTAHGDCSGLSPQDYFSLTLKLYNDLDVAKLLANLKVEGVSPGQKSFTNAKLQRAFSDVLAGGTNVEIKCASFKNQVQLLEVRVHFDPHQKTSVPYSGVSNSCKGINDPVFLPN